MFCFTCSKGFYFIYMKGVGRCVSGWLCVWMYVHARACVSGDTGAGE